MPKVVIPKGRIDLNTALKHAVNSGYALLMDLCPSYLKGVVPNDSNNFVICDPRPGRQELNPSFSMTCGAPALYKRFGYEDDDNQGNALTFVMQMKGWTKAQAARYLIGRVSEKVTVLQAPTFATRVFTPAIIGPLSDDDVQQALAGCIPMEEGLAAHDDLSQRGLAGAKSLETYMCVRRPNDRVQPGALAFIVSGPDGKPWNVKARNPPGGNARDPRYATLSPGHGAPAWCSPRYGQGESVFLIEGELNGAAAYEGLRHVGLDNIDVQGLASASGKPHTQGLEGKRVLIYMDDDEPGRKACARLGEFARAAGASEVIVLRPLDGGDACDVAGSQGLEALGEQLQRRLVEATANEAQSSHAVTDNVTELHPSEESSKSSDTASVRLPSLPTADEIPPPTQESKYGRDYPDAVIVHLLGKSHWNVTAPDSDVAHARRYEEMVDGNVRYCDKLGGFIVWDDKTMRWLHGDSKKTGNMAAQELVQALSSYMKPEVAFLWELCSVLALSDRKADATAMSRSALKLTSSLKAIEGRSRQRAVLECVRPYLAIDHTAFEIRPNLIGFANGVWDHGVSRESRREDYLLHHSPVSLDLKADTSTWQPVISRITGNNKELEHTFQDMCAYILSGQSSHRKLPWLYGPPGTGKSTLIELLLTVLDSSAQVIDVAKLSSGAARERLGADIWGKRLVVCHEAGNARLDAESLKTLSGGDRIPVRKLYSEGFTASPKHVPAMVSNDPPNLNAYDEGLRDRILALPFVHRMDDITLPPLLGGSRLELVRRDPDSELVRAFLRWAVEGLDRFHRTGRIYISQTAVAATKEFWQDVDPLDSFWLEYGSEKFSIGVTPTDLHDACKDWCRRMDQPMPARPQWMQACKSVGLEQTRTGKGRYWELVRPQDFPTNREADDLAPARS